MNTKKTIFILILVLATLAFFQACGEDPGAQATDGIRLVGSISTGSPVQGDVHAIDTQGNHYSGTSDDDGSFSITLPSSVAAITLDSGYFVTAVGRANGEGSLMQISAFVNGPGTANINPLTHAALSLALQADPSVALNLQEMISGDTNYLTNISPELSTRVAQSKQVITDILLSILPPGASAADLLACNITPSQTELLKLLNAINLDVSGGLLIFVNSSTGEEITSISNNIDIDDTNSYTNAVDAVVTEASNIVETINDTTAPAIASTLIAITTTNIDSLSLSWTAANDAVTTNTMLQYKVVYSLEDNITGIIDANNNGTTAIDWTTNLTTATITNLKSGTTYYLAVLVKDAANNVTNYTMKAADTPVVYTVTFDDQGATTPVDPTSIDVIAYSSVESLPIPPATANSNFSGWYTAINGGGTEFDTNTIVNGNLTIYAKWITNSPFIIDSIDYVNGGGGAINDLNSDDFIRITFSEEINPVTIHSSLTKGGAIILDMNAITFSFTENQLTIAYNTNVSIGAFSVVGNVISGFGGTASADDITLDASGKILTIPIYNASGWTFATTSNTDYINFTPNSAITSALGIPITVAPIKPTNGSTIF